MDSILHTPMTSSPQSKPCDPPCGDPLADKVFGNNGINKVFKEVQQFHDREVIIPKNPSQLTKEERHCALPYLMFLKEKRNPTTKG